VDIGETKGGRALHLPMPGAWPDDGFDTSIVFLPPSAVAHDPSVLGPFDGAGPHDLRSLQEMMDDITPPDSGDDDDAESAASSSPRGGVLQVHADGGSMRTSHTGTGNGEQQWAVADRGKPLADGSHYPPERQRMIELQALMRAKDRDLQQKAREICEVTKQLEDAQHERDLYFSRSADWQAKASDWECENTALRKELTHATSTISVLEEQSQQLQAELSKATASINTLQIRVDELLQGEALITASQYEHHLNQLRSEAHTARTDAAAWRQEAAELRAILDEQISQDADTHAHNHTPGAGHQQNVSNTTLLFDVSVQTEIIATPNGMGGGEGEGSSEWDAGCGTLPSSMRGAGGYMVAQHLTTAATNETTKANHGHSGAESVLSTGYLSTGSNAASGDESVRCVLQAQVRYVSCLCSDILQHTATQYITQRHAVLQAQVRYVP